MIESGWRMALGARMNLSAVALVVLLLLSVMAAGPSRGDERIGDLCRHHGAIVVGPNRPCLHHLPTGTYRVELWFSEDATGVARADFVVDGDNRLTARQEVRFGRWHQGSSSGNIPFYHDYDELKDRRIGFHIYVVEPGELSLRVEPWACSPHNSGTCSADLVGIPLGEFTYEVFPLDDF